MAGHVFHHHDGVVHHQADGQHHRQQGQRIDGKAEEVHQRAGAHQRHGDGDDGDDAGAQVAQEVLIVLAAQIHQQVVERFAGG
ncbi:hypothetical protein G6F64_014762 [Rhizopus arrhizus]|uniref:Uncharacterized protein n=1 Tax=Rhizopus oryzae TaxID=64495 RepID=A0A9P7BJB0_RHIOR|nr:hypothetical protein G6F64_014762 [Rhizopus arrhizus]